MRKSDFYKFATDKCNVSCATLDKYQKTQSGILKPSAGYVPYINPSILEERQLNVTQMDVFSRLMMDRIIFLGDEIDSYTANVVQAQLLYLSSVDPEKEIQLYLNTPGGSVYDGLAVYDTMQYINNDITTICTGMAASMGSILLCAGTEGQRFALPHSRVMIHQPLGGCHGQASDIEIEAREILKIKDELYDILSKHTGQSIEQITTDADRDHWFTAQEALEYGLIDEIFIKQKN